MPRDLNLGYPTWLSLPNWVVKIVVPLLEGDQVVDLHAVVGLGKTRYQPNNSRPGLKVISRIGKRMTLVHVNDVMPCKS